MISFQILPLIYFHLHVVTAVNINQIWKRSNPPLRQVVIRHKLNRAIPEEFCSLKRELINNGIALAP